MDNRKGLAVAKLQGLIESGLDPDQIIATLQQEDAEKHRVSEEGPDDETFADEIKIIAQALAFRVACEDDIPAITNLLRQAYLVETDGSESFRTGDSFSTESVIALYSDPSYRWLIVEAPNGQGVEVDGVMLGICCYSMDGVSRRNGEVEGNLGSIRVIAVLDRFRGLCIGLRLLKRVEAEMTENSCCRSMLCIPSKRTNLANWAKKRGYTKVNSVPYPSGLGHALTSIDLKLDVFTKKLPESSRSAGPEPEILPPLPSTSRPFLPPHWRQDRLLAPKPPVSAIDENIGSTWTGIEAEGRARLAVSEEVIHTSRHDPILPSDGSSIAAEETSFPPSPTIIHAQADAAVATFRDVARIDGDAEVDVPDVD